MVYISDETLDRMIEEDTPYVDLTTWALDIGEKAGRIRYFTREEAVLCGTEEAARIFAKLGIAVTSTLPSGARLAPGQAFLEGEGPAQALHIAWKVCQNLLDNCSGIATKTRRLVDAVQAVNPKVAVVCTRKSFPGIKQLCVKAILHGGAFPHRLGTSESVLVFAQHLNFLGGLEGFLAKLPEIRPRITEKRLTVEAASIEEGILLAKAGVDALQFDKLPPETLREGAPAIRAVHPGIILLAAGGITEENAAAYAQTGVDALVTTSLFSAKPIDMGVRIDAL